MQPNGEDLNKKTGLKLAAILSGLAISAVANADPFQVYVGYADRYRAGAFFPSPYDGADIFQGNMGTRAAPERFRFRQPSHYLQSDLSP